MRFQLPTWDAPLPDTAHVSCTGRSSCVKKVVIVTADL